MLQGQFQPSDQLVVAFYRLFVHRNQILQEMQLILKRENPLDVA